MHGSGCLKSGSGVPPLGFQSEQSRDGSATLALS